METPYSSSPEREQNTSSQGEFEERDEEPKSPPKRPRTDDSHPQLQLTSNPYSSDHSLATSFLDVATNPSQPFPATLGSPTTSVALPQGQGVPFPQQGQFPFLQHYLTGIPYNPFSPYYSVFLPVTPYAPTTTPMNVHLPPNGSIFELAEQIFPKQRKSYTKESRYLTPNPIQIVKRSPRENETLPAILQGTITVQLASEQGSLLPENKQATLKSRSQSLIEPLSVRDRAKFSLLITQTSEGKLYRLLFTVKYQAELPDGTRQDFEEKILSNPFHVDSNQRSHMKKPIVKSLLPKEAPSNAITEVWIKGKGFLSAVVHFGGREAKVLEVQDNLLIVQAPPREELQVNTIVEVVVSNRILNTVELRKAEEKLLFTYRVDTPKVPGQEIIQD